MASRPQIIDVLDEINCAKDNGLGGRKGACSARCNSCGKFFFKTDLSCVVLVTNEETKDVLVCRGCRMKLHTKEVEVVASRFGIDPDVCAGLSKIFRKTKSTSAQSMMHGKFKSHGLTLADVLALWIKQGGKCALSGQEMRPDLIGLGALRAPSLDRIDSSRGYIPGNVQWVCWAVNLMKQDLTQNQFLAWCSEVALHGRMAAF